MKNEPNHKNLNSNIVDVKKQQILGFLTNVTLLKVFFELAILQFFKTTLY